MLLSTLLYLLGIMSIGYALPFTLNEIDHADEMMYILDRDLPIDLTSSIIQKRESGGIFICTDIDWSGTCGYAKQPLGVCIVLTSPYKDTISSFGPDDGYAAVVYAFIVLGVVGSVSGSGPDKRGFQPAAIDGSSDSPPTEPAATTPFVEIREVEATAKPTSTPSQGYTNDKREIDEATAQPDASAKSTSTPSQGYTNDKREIDEATAKPTRSAKPTSTPSQGYTHNKRDAQPTARAKPTTR
ncbi:hypothetical protein B7494_g3385 [Chlorociboria aeruginascens]|nr:hypothetical protein B7494_g3385 [Chlorociboria aeruginascens]